MYYWFNVLLQANESATVIVQKHDLGCKASTDPITINEINQNTPTSDQFWEILGGQEVYQGKMKRGVLTFTVVNSSKPWLHYKKYSS